MPKPARIPAPDRSTPFPLLAGLGLYLAAEAAQPFMPGPRWAQVARLAVAAALVVLLFLSRRRPGGRLGGSYRLTWIFMTVLTATDKNFAASPLWVTLLPAFCFGWPARRSLVPWIERYRALPLATVLLGVAAGVAFHAHAIAGLPKPLRLTSLQLLLHGILVLARSWMILAALRATGELIRRWVRRASIRAKLVISFGIFAVTPAVLVMAYFTLASWVRGGEFRAEALERDLRTHSAARGWVRAMRANPPRDAADLAARLNQDGQLLADRGLAAVGLVGRPSGWNLCGRVGGSDSLFLPAASPRTDSSAVIHGLAFRDQRGWWVESAIWPRQDDTLAVLTFEAVDSTRLAAFAEEMNCDVLLRVSGSGSIKAPGMTIGEDSLDALKRKRGRITIGQTPPETNDSLELAVGQNVGAAVRDSLLKRLRFSYIGAGAYRDIRHPGQLSTTPNAGGTLPLNLWQAGRWGPSRAVVLVHTSFWESVAPENPALGGMRLATRIALTAIAVVFLVFEILSLVYGSRVAGFITRGVRNLIVATSAIRRGDFSARVQVPSEDEFGKLAASFNEMSAGLAAGQLAMLEREQLRRELELARRIQFRLLPSAPPRIPRLDVAAINAMSQQVGGDYYDFVSMGDGRMGLCIADVSGKGVGAALLMSSVKAALTASAGVEDAPDHITVRVNRFLEQSIEPGKFVTFFFASLDPVTLRLEYVNAGHPAPILLRRDGSVELLETGGTILGIDAGAKFEAGAVELRPGDVLAMYTDGVSEAQGEREELYGEERIEELLRRERHRPAAEILEVVVREVKAFEGDRGPSDDLTAMVIRVLEPGEAAGATA